MKPKFGMMIVDGRNKLGDTVYSRNHYGTYVRQWVIPNNPNTAKQINVRSNFSFLSSQWKSETQVFRNGWIHLAAKIKDVNNLAERHYSTGFNLYMYCHLNVSLQGGLAPFNTNQVTYPLPVPNISAVVDTGTTTMTLNYAHAVGISTDLILIYITNSLSHGILQPSNQFRIINVSHFINQVSENLWAAYIAIMPAPVAGMRIFFKCVPMTSTGFLGIPITCFANVT
jgi:hypothetical protein